MYNNQLYWTSSSNYHYHLQSTIGHANTYKTIHRPSLVAMSND